MVDSKPVSYDDATCPICHPEIAQQQAKEQTEILPRVYRKGNTIVVKISKVTLITLTPYAEADTFLWTFQRMLREADGAPVRGADDKPKWMKLTTRANAHILTDFIHLASALIKEQEPQSEAPQRNGQ